MAHSPMQPAPDFVQVMVFMLAPGGATSHGVEAMHRGKDNQEQEGKPNTVRGQRLGQNRKRGIHLTNLPNSRLESCMSRNHCTAKGRARSRRYVRDDRRSAVRSGLSRMVLLRNGDVRSLNCGGQCGIRIVSPPESCIRRFAATAACSANLIELSPLARGLGI